MKKKSTSWGLIAVVLYFFFPVGIWLMVKKITGEKHRYAENGKALRVFAVVLLFLALSTVLMYAAGELQFEDGSNELAGVILVCLFFTIPGIFVYWKADRYIRRGKRYKDCIYDLVSKDSVELDTVAAELRISTQDVVADFQEMISAGHIYGAYIDMRTRTLVKKPIVRPKREFVCPCCGAKNSVEVNAVIRCEYCDSVLQSDIGQVKTGI